MTRNDPAPVFAEHMNGLHERLGNLTAAITAMTPRLLGVETRKFDSTGVVELDFRVPFHAVTVQAKSFNDLYLIASPKGAGQPDQGPGVAILHGGYSGATFNLRGHSLTIYGGSSGDRITVQIFSRPVSPAFGGPQYPQVSPFLGSMVTAQFAATSVTAHGTAAAPAAGVAIATTAALPNGLYQIALYRYFEAGAPAVADADNIDLRVGGVSVLVPCTPAVVSGSNPPAMWQGRASAQAVTANAVGAATAGVTYNATIVATQVGA